MQWQWLQRPETKAKEQEIWSRQGMIHERASRTLQSNFRTLIYVTYGGKAWVHWFLMLGYVPDLLIQLFNKYIRQRVLETEAGAFEGGSPESEEVCPEPRCIAGRA